MAKKRFYTDGKEAMREGGRMIREDASAPCHLPREVMDKDWPSSDGYLGGHIKDLFDAVNSQMKEDGGDLRKHTPKKY